MHQFDTGNYSIRDSLFSFGKISSSVAAAFLRLLVCRTLVLYYTLFSSSFSFSISLCNSAWFDLRLGHTNFKNDMEITE